VKPLAIVPVYSTKPGDVDLLARCVNSLRESEGDRIDILLIDDGSPDDHLKRVAANIASKHEADFHAKEENSGFSATVNVGLRRALDEGRDAILVNADLEIPPGRKWLDLMQSQERVHGKGLASVVGGLLLFGNGLIQHGGVYFSLLTRTFDHRFKYAPANLREARSVAACPVTGAFFFIRHECLEGVGLFDESFKMGYEDMDYCFRVFLSDRECVYQPKIRAIHHESMFRGARSEKLDKWHTLSFVRLMKKYESQNFAGLVPSL
jgi:GT2 family glycosyltransferase